MTISKYSLLRTKGAKRTKKTKRARRRDPCSLASLCSTKDICSTKNLCSPSSIDKLFSDPCGSSSYCDPEVLRCKLEEKRLAMTLRNARLRYAMEMKQYNLGKQIAAQEACQRAMDDVIQARMNPGGARPQWLTHLRRALDRVAPETTAITIPGGESSFTDYGYGGGYGGVEGFGDYYDDGQVDLFSGEYY